MCLSPEVAREASRHVVLMCRALSPLLFLSAICLCLRWRRGLIFRSESARLAKLYDACDKLPSQLFSIDYFALFERAQFHASDMSLDATGLALGAQPHFFLCWIAACVAFRLALCRARVAHIARPVLARAAFLCSCERYPETPRFDGRQTVRFRFRLGLGHVDTTFILCCCHFLPLIFEIRSGPAARAASELSKKSVPFGRSAVKRSVKSLRRHLARRLLST